ncbi:hypothetical protein [Streptomyces sp. NRRL F-5193]|uniref:hypothetical protein n=1 Tax=Streptomyces sp. NRRL F-5193 TaxID=1463860 RepID=UPI000D1461B3|nr:hypothetical protein [Streptomyces sp. NRRL F-5193]
MRNRIRRALHLTRPRHARTAHPHKPLRRAAPLGQSIIAPSTPLAIRHVFTAEHPHPAPAEAA